MPSGIFTFAALDKIIVDREGRQRRDIDEKKLDELADSIDRNGLIHPPVVTRDFHLVAGERRIAAMRKLGWDQCSIQFVDDLEPSALRQIELEENIKRVDISWQDRVRAVEEYHELRRAEDPAWTAEKTAAAVGDSYSSARQILQVAKEMRVNPELAKAKEYSVARNITFRQEARRTRRAEDALNKSLGEEKASAILTADFTVWAEEYSGPKFNFLHCDFPYGINANNFAQGSAVKHGGYDDTPDAYRRLYRALGENLDKLLEDSAHVIFWFSMQYYHETLEWFNNETNFVVSQYPLVWLKSDNSGALPKPNHGPRQIYETAFFGYRGDRPVVKAKANAYAAPSVRDEHMSVKPEPMLRHFFEMVVDQNTTMLDPTCGSGSALRAADSLKAARILGLEVNPEFAERSNHAFEKAKQLRKVA